MCAYHHMYVDEHRRRIRFECKKNALTSAGLCEFHDPSYLNENTRKIVAAAFLKEVEQNNHSTLLCVGYHLPELNVKNQRFRKVHFIETQFHGHVDFSSTEFEKELILDNVACSSMSFTKAIFDGEVRFERLDMDKHGEISFKSSIFKEKCTFTRGVFHKTKFNRVKFENDVRFVDINFQNTSDFLGSEFRKKAEFRNLRFDAYVDFSFTKFEQELNIYNVTCFGVSFTGAEFGGKVEFNGLEMHEQENISFVSSKFKAECEFLGDNLHNVEFTGSAFEKDALFMDVDFYGKTNFQNSEFMKKAEFRNVKFMNGVNFIFSEINRGIFIKTIFGEHSECTNVVFREPKLTVFNADLSNVSFAGTDISCVVFDEYVRWGPGTTERFVICEERDLIKNPETITVDAVLSVYRNLRINYEFKMKYEEASEFFVREMEIQRNRYKEGIRSSLNHVLSIGHGMIMWLCRCVPGLQERYKKDGEGSESKPRYFWNWVLLSAYYWLGKYGEDVKRPLLWLGIIIGGAALFFAVFPDEAMIRASVQQNAGTQNDNTHMIVKRILASFLQVNSNTLPDILVRITSIPVLGMLFIVLRRRFERRFRH